MFRKKILLTNGCSFVNGAGLQDRESERWSYHLAKKLNMEDINLSSEGASNDRILRTTIEWLKENKDKLSDVLVVIGWTQMTRTEFFNDVIGKWENQNFLSFGDGSEDYYGEQSKVKHIHKSPDDTWWRVYLKYYFSMEQRYNSFFNSILYSQSIFKSFGIDYIYFASFDNELEKISFEDLIDEKHIIRDNMILNDFSDDAGHPGIKSHKKWADFLFEKIVEKNEK
jgi:hypothetical protein